MVAALMTRLVLKVLGEFTALANNGDPVVVISKKNRALLAVLALAPNGSATRERLCDLLWSDRGPEQARSSLRQALGRAETRFRQLNHSTIHSATTEHAPSELSLALREYLRRRRAA